MKLTDSIGRMYSELIGLNNYITQSNEKSIV